MENWNPHARVGAAYVRVSTDDQAELSPDSQLSVIRDYAEKNGVLIPDELVFIDEGISGRKAAKRPAFNRMIAAAKQEDHPFDCILVWKFSRFARNQEESIVYKAMLRKDRVEVVSVSEPLVEGPFGSLIERILEWMDEYYSIRLSGEVKRSMTLNAQRGVRQTAPPFGYQLQADGTGNRVMVPEPREAALVREMYRRFLDGEGLYPLAKWLNAAGVRTHRGGAFENRTVEYILRNPVYIGKVRWTPTGKTRRSFDNPDTIVADGTHEPIVGDDVWRAAQERMRAVKEQWGYKARPSSELKDWLGGVVRCGACGATLIFVKPRYFKCNNYVKGRCTCSQHVRADVLHEALIGRLTDDAEGVEPLDYQLSVRDGSGADEVKRLELALDTLERKRRRIRESYAAGIDTLEEYRKYREEVDAEKTAILARMEDLRRREDPERINADLKARLRQVVEVLKDPDAAKEQKNASVRDVVAACRFEKNGMRIRMTYRVSL